MLILFIYLLLASILAIHRVQHKQEYESRLSIAFLIPLAIAAASAIYQGVKGAKQKREAAKLQKEADALERVNVNEARRMALTGTPEAEYQRQLQNINRNQALQLSYAKDRRMALAAAPNIQQATNDATMQLAAQDAQARQQNERLALGQANRASGLKGERAMYERQSGEALTGAAMQNVFNAAGYGAMALGGAGSSGSGGLFGNSSEGAYNRMLLGTNPMSGGSSMQPVSSGLSKPLPRLNYAKPY